MSEIHSLAPVMCWTSKQLAALHGRHDEFKWTDFRTQNRHPYIRVKEAIRLGLLSRWIGTKELAEKLGIPRANTYDALLRVQGDYPALLRSRRAYRNALEFIALSREIS